MDIKQINKKDVILLAILVAVCLVALGLDIACIYYVFQVITEKVGLFVAATVFNLLVVAAVVWLVIHMKNMMATIKNAQAVETPAPAPPAT